MTKKVSTKSTQATNHIPDHKVPTFTISLVLALALIILLAFSFFHMQG